jgi:hypothetical protein
MAAQQPAQRVHQRLKAAKVRQLCAEMGRPVPPVFNELLLTRADREQAR